MLGDLPDEAIERATLVLIQTKREVYPGTNWLAELRVTAVEQARTSLKVRQLEEKILHGT